jgi:hypothetical protein
VCMYVCSLITREGILHFTPNLAYLYLETSKRSFKGQNSKSVLSSSPGESGSCSSKTKADRRTTPRTKLFVSASRLQKQRP